MKPFKYIEANVPEELTVRVHHYHQGNSPDLGRSTFVTHAQLVNKRGQVLSEDMALCTIFKKSHRRNIRRQIAVGRALKKLIVGGNNQEAQGYVKQ